MKYLKYVKCAIVAECVLLTCMGFFMCAEKDTALPAAATEGTGRGSDTADEGKETQENEDYIKWVEFHATEEILSAAYRLDVESYGEKVHLSWIDLLAYVAAKHGGQFPGGCVREMEQTAEKLRSRETTIEELTQDMQYFSYYQKAYSAILGGFVGEYQIQKKREDGRLYWENCYGLKAFSPVARGFYYEDYDDFGASRSYGYARPHLGHDMMGQIGTPIIAVESGYVEALGWNRYGGWRIGIRSFDKKRYYYYAHLRQNFPYNKELKEGSVVTAGDVIGYMGHTGYSDTENVNNIKTVHLHWGLQLIFDESQKEGNNEIWVDCYQLTKFLYKNRSETEKDEETKEWHRVCDMKDPAVEAFVKK
ncbi:M23 family metallopeptidase [Lachnospiraceae bacterium JLR.KK008]